MQSFKLLILLLCQLWASGAYGENDDMSLGAESVFDVTDEGASTDDSVFSNIDAIEQNSQVRVEGKGYYSSANLVAINKITAKSKQITVKMGQSAHFDNAELKLHRCFKDGSSDATSNQMLITVVENKFDEDPRQIFHGWLISSAPALSTLEHPVYEVVASECTGNKVE